MSEITSLSTQLRKILIQLNPISKIINDLEINLAFERNGRAELFARCEQLEHERLQSKVEIQSL